VLVCQLSLLSRETYEKGRRHVRYGRSYWPCYNADMIETFPRDVQEFVQQAIANGEFANEDDVVIAGVRALRELKQRHAILRQDIQVAVAELDRGEGEPWDADAIKAELDEQLDANSETG
jgi:putative addiction module CopG family antidote